MGVHEAEVELAGGEVDADDADIDDGAEAVFGMGAFADDASAFDVGLPPIVAEVFEAEETVHEVAGMLHEEAEARDPGDDPIEGLADLVLEEGQDLEHLQFSFRGFRATGEVGHLASGLFKVAEGGETGWAAFAAAGALEFAVEVSIQHAVEHQVRVSADGAGEMCVVFAGEGVMPDGFRGVFRHLHGLEHREIDGIAFRLSAQMFQEFLQIADGDLFGHGHAGDAQEPGHGHQGVLVRLRVDAAEDGDLEAVHQACGGLIGLHHEHLDDGMAEAGILRFGVDDLAVLIEDQVHGRQFQHEHALAQPPIPDDAGQRLHFLDEFDDVFWVSVAAALQDFGGMVIGKSSCGADEGIGEAGVEHFALRVVTDEGALGEARFALLEAADAVGQDLRQHGDHVTRQVHRGAALFRLFIQGGAGGHERADVRDVDTELPGGCAAVLFGALAAEPSQRDGVVEIAGVVRVDGDDEGVGEVFAVAGGGIGVESVDAAACILGDLRGETVGQMELADDGQQVHAGLAAFAQALHDDPAGRPPFLGVLRDLGHDLVALPGGFGARIPNQDRAMQQVAVRLYVPGIGVAHQLPDKAAFAPFEDTDDLAAQHHLSVALGALDHADQDPVAGHGVARVLARHVQIAVCGGFIGDHEAEPAGVGAVGARDLPRGMGQHQRVAGADHHTPHPAQGVHRGMKIPVLRLPDAHGPGQRPRAHGLVVRALHVIQDSFGKGSRHTVLPKSLHILPTSGRQGKQGSGGVRCSGSSGRGEVNSKQ